MDRLDQLVAEGVTQVASWGSGRPARAAAGGLSTEEDLARLDVLGRGLSQRQVQHVWRSAAVFAPAFPALSICAQRLPHLIPVGAQRVKAEPAL